MPWHFFMPLIQSLKPPLLYLITDPLTPHWPVVRYERGSLISRPQKLIKICHIECSEVFGFQYGAAIAGFLLNMLDDWLRLTSVCFKVEKKSAIRTSPSVV